MYNGDILRIWIKFKTFSPLGEGWGEVFESTIEAYPGPNL